MQDKKNKNITWQSPEFIYYHKSPGWYLGLAIFGLITMGYAVWRTDYLMLFTLIVMFTVAYFYAGRKPKTITVTLSGKGVSLDKNLYYYKNLQSFWILYEPPEVKTLNFETTNYLNRDITIQLENEDPNEIREFLLNFLPENLDREESTTDRLFRRLKF